MTDQPTTPNTELPFLTDLTCPACGSTGFLFVGEGGYVTCSVADCPNPDYSEAIKVRLSEARKGYVPESRINKEQGSLSARINGKDSVLRKQVSSTVFDIVKWSKGRGGIGIDEGINIIMGIVATELAQAEKRGEDRVFDQILTAIADGRIEMLTVNIDQLKAQLNPQKPGEES